MLQDVIAVLAADGPVTPSLVLGVMGDILDEHPAATCVEDIPDEDWWELVDRRPVSLN